jgi:predicted  nucleic acid-binding Zn ribbon protein
MTPSVFVKAVVKGEAGQISPTVNVLEFFKCPECGSGSLADKKDHLLCPSCKSQWAVIDGIYDFRDKR